jgi:hypothetical protein
MTMAMSEADRTALLDRWVLTSSSTEQDRMERAERMIVNAIDAHKPFDGYRGSFRVYAKGSYANETNVRLDSDVDIVVESHHSYYDDFLSPELQQASPPNTSWQPYEGPWVPSVWRAEVETALKNYFGASDVDTSGEVAITIKEKPGSRPSADVVPAYKYLRYDSADRRQVNQGSKVFKKTSGSLVNWPAQQLENGNAKNGRWRTNGRYKQFARALKNGENALVDAGLMDEKPSYFMECLAYNLPDAELTQGSTTSAWFRWSLAWLFNNLRPAEYVQQNWAEPNELKYLFHSSQKWSVEDGRELARKLWDYLEYE